VRVGEGQTRLVAVDKLFVTQGSMDSDGSLLRMVATIRTAWVHQGSDLPADQPQHTMIVQVYNSGSDAGWGVVAYEPPA
jgi:hypothetical protein